MKIYKITQNIESPSFSVWIAQELSKKPHLVVSSTDIKTLQEWIENTNPNLGNYDLYSAYDLRRESAVMIYPTGESRQLPFVTP